MSERRTRSALACQTCRQRKVRCSLTVTGAPCLTCSQSAGKCIVEPRGHPNQPRAHAKKSWTRHSPQRSQHERGREGNTTTSDRWIQNLPRLIPRVHPPEPPPQYVGNSVSVDAGFDRSDNPPLRNSDPGCDDEKRKAMGIVDALENKPSGGDHIHFYPGDHTGLTSILEVCSTPESFTKHLPVSPSPLETLSDEDREYLKLKGVFSLPCQKTCTDLLHAFLYHVHPFVPVLDISHVINYAQTNRLSRYNIMLLWAIFFSAASFVPDSVWRLEGYRSRSEMRKTMYLRARSMYSISHGAEPIARIQTSLLLGFWHSGMGPHGLSEGWYWTGTAITLCQMLGLYRNPDARNINTTLSTGERLLWRRIWWSCYLRDCWLGLTLGRTLRVNLGDCDTPMVTVEDILYDFNHLQPGPLADEVPSEMPRIAEFWVQLLELTKLLGRVLSINYQLNGPFLSLPEFEALENDLLQVKFSFPSLAGSSSNISAFHFYHLQMHYQAVLITFYRPFITTTPSDLSPNEEEEWRKRMRNNVETAASQTNAILELLVQNQLLWFAGSVTPPLLVPAMHTHLINCKSFDPLVRRVAYNKLDLCMLFLEELQWKNPAAGIFLGIFTKAIKHINSENRTTTITTPETSTLAPAGFTVERSSFTTKPGSPEHEDPVVDATMPPSDFMEEFGDMPIIDDRVVDSLMNEASMFHFWDNYGQL